MSIATEIQRLQIAKVNIKASIEAKGIFVSNNVTLDGYSSMITSIPYDPYNGHDYVEIAGIKWATMNIGATSVTDMGLYFQWGDTAGYTAELVDSKEVSYTKPFNWQGYKFANGKTSPGETGMIKYNNNDQKQILDLSDDAARMSWGGAWKIPTKEDFQTLGNAVNAVWTDNYQNSGVAGLICTDKNDSSKVLFFPAGGYCVSSTITKANEYGRYWSSSIYNSTTIRGYSLGFLLNIVNWSANNIRYAGLTIRGIIESPKLKIITKFNIIDTNNPTQIGYDGYTYGFSIIEIDGIKLSNVVSEYTFSTIGEHTIEYTLNLTTIDDHAFDGCTNLTNITIPDGIISINDSAFKNCTGLTSIIIPDSITSINSNAFNNCTNLTSITIESTTPPVLENLSAFTNTGDCPIYVPCNSINTYKSETIWSDLSSRIQVIPGSCLSMSVSEAIITCDDAVYNGNIQIALNIVVILNGVTLINNTDYTITENNGGTNAGNYTFTVNGIGNYYDTVNSTFTINKVTPTVTAPTAKSLTYNGSAQALVNAGSTNWGTLLYSSDNVTWNTNIPSETNAGSYYVYYRVVGDSNINDIAYKSRYCTIYKVTPTVTSPVAKNLTYNGLEQELIIAGSTNWGTLKYAVLEKSSYYDSEIKYLKSDGHQYIDLPITPDANTGIYIKYCPIMYNYNNTHDQYIVGLRNTSNGNTRWCLGRSGTGHVSTYYGYGSYDYIGGYDNVNNYENTIYECTLNYLNSKKATKNDLYVNLPSLSFTPSYPIRIFGSSGVNDTYSKASIYLYNCKVSQGSTVVMDLIPVRKNNTGYLYDKLSGTLYSNNGSSSFTLGLDTLILEYSTAIPVRKNVGSYTVYYKVDGDSNINSVNEQTIQCSIN